MTEQSSPLYLLELLQKIIMENELQKIKMDVEKLLLAVELHHLPKPFVHGKQCSNCEHRMQCKSVRCPNCHKEQRKRKREPRGQKKDDGGEEEARKEKEEEEKKKEEEKECKGECAKDLTGLEYHTLSCGHKFCTTCMGGRVKRGFSTCCMCNTVCIPEDVRSKYLQRDNNL